MKVLTKLIFLQLFFVLTPIHAAQYKSVFGFEFQLPKGWEALKPDPLSGVYNNEVLQTLGPENIFQNKGYGHLLRQIKAGKIEYIFESQKTVSHFKNNIRIQIVNQEADEKGLSIDKLCEGHQKRLSAKTLSERVVVKKCTSVKVKQLEYLKLVYFRPVLGVTIMLSDIPIGKHSKMRLWGSSNRQGIKLLDKTQADLAKTVIKYYGSIRQLSEKVNKDVEEQKHEVAIKDLTKVADFGDARAEYSLGLIHELGKGVPVNLSKAFQYYSAAANKEFGPAVKKVADAYHAGKPVAKDVAKALGLYKKAAIMGVPGAQNKYASLLYQGIDVGMDRKEAKKWFRKAASQGDPQAIKNLVSIYKVESRFGNSKSSHALAQMYFEGLGVGKDPIRGVELLEQAANKGYKPARQSLVEIYTEGLHGLSKNQDLALKWSLDSE